MNKKIVIINGEDSKEIHFDIKLSQFSHFFLLDDEKDLCFKIPSTVHLDTKYIELVQAFLQTHNYDSTRILISKVHLEPLENSMNKQTVQFIEQHLNPMSDEQIREYLKVCEYLQIEVAQSLVYTYLASKYLTPYSNEQTLAMLQQHDAIYSAEQLTELKQKYFPYFQAFGETIFQQFHKNKQKY